MGTASSASSAIEINMDDPPFLDSELFANVSKVTVRRVTLETMRDCEMFLKLMGILATLPRISTIRLARIRTRTERYHSAAEGDGVSALNALQQYAGLRAPWDHEHRAAPSPCSLPFAPVPISPSLRVLQIDAMYYLTLPYLALLLDFSSSRLTTLHIGWSAMDIPDRSSMYNEPLKMFMAHIWTTAASPPEHLRIDSGSSEWGFKIDPSHHPSIYEALALPMTTLRGISVNRCSFNWRRLLALPCPNLVRINASSSMKHVLQAIAKQQQRDHNTRLFETLDVVFIDLDDSNSFYRMLRRKGDAGFPRVRMIGCHACEAVVHSRLTSTLITTTSRIRRDRGGWAVVHRGIREYQEKRLRENMDPQPIALRPSGSGNPADAVALRARHPSSSICRLPHGALTVIRQYVGVVTVFEIRDTWADWA
jgi:hypothetical protein